MDDDVYEEAGMGRSVGFGDNPAIVIVDVQRAFTDAESPLGADVDETVESITSLLDVARGEDVPILASAACYSESLDDAAYFAHKIESNDVLVRGSEWVELDPRLPTEDVTVIEKHQPSVFFGTELDTILTYNNVDTVVVTGLTTSGCVRATVVDACSHGYRVIVPEGAVADRLESPHRANLFDMDAKYADVLPLEQVKGYFETSTVSTP